ncbi:MAG TPA: PD-(D/E)XK nuclease family protein, partial [Burkholderiales bacterium]|nr:PD-(D/E)XK nuclease family protein [Burkholderiales bacterium]
MTELPAFGDGPRTISPTDLTQYIRLDQCQRCLRLRLHERAHGLRFLYDYDVRPQAISPLLTRSGATFERHVEAAIQGRYATQSFAAGVRRDPAAHDNDAVVRLARELAPGNVLVLAQPRLFVTLGRWRMRGDIDLLRLERDAAGALHLLIADMKSSPAARVEHRLQVACYLAMLETLLAESGVPVASLRMGILYRGPAEGAGILTDADRLRQQAEAAAALDLFNVPDALLEIVEDVEAYRGSVRDLVTDENSVAERVATAPFDSLFFHLTQKCDGCLYSEFCMKRSAERDDLSLLPHLALEEKLVLQRAGLTTTRAVAALKELPAQADGATIPELVTPPAQEPLVRQLAAAWPVGPHLDELIHRARRYRRLKGDPLRALSYIPSNGYGSLPYCDAQHNPNLVRIYIDAQHDYLEDRIYLLGALVSAAEGGVEMPARRRSIVHLTDGPPETPAQERELFVGFARALLRAVVEVAAPDEAGEARAPIHLIFYDHYGQRLLLEGLARHLGSILEATPLYDFVTQLAAFDSPIVSFLDQEIREQKNYPMLCQSLQAVASQLKFEWKSPEPYSERFHARLFDYWSKFSEAPEGRVESRWYTGRARFSSQIPLEYAYAAWGELPRPAPGTTDDYAPYRAATPALLRGFQARRIEAM